MEPIEEEKIDYGTVEDIIIDVKQNNKNNIVL